MKFLFQLSDDSSPLFQIPDWQLSSESSEDGESAFPWLPSHPQAVLQIPDGSQAFEVDHSDEDSVAPTSPTPSDEAAESTNTDTGTPDKNGKRQYTCPVCAKTYRLRSSLEKHLKVPCEIRPYKCPICQKAFKRPDHLKAHSRMHTGERPYLCSLCGKTFRQKNHLQRHSDRKHVNGKVVDDGEDVDQDQSSTFDVCGLEELEDDEMRAEDQDWLVARLVCKKKKSISPRKLKKAKRKVGKERKSKKRKEEKAKDMNKELSE